MTQIDPIALFRLSVLGPLISRPLQRGEFQKTLWELAGREYAIPGSRRTRLSHKTIAGWYYAWRKDSIDGLSPRPRRDQGQSKLAPEIQEAILRLKQENPRRSLLQILQALESTGLVSRARFPVRPSIVCCSAMGFPGQPVRPVSPRRSAASSRTVPAPSGMAT